MWFFGFMVLWGFPDIQIHLDDYLTKNFPLTDADPLRIT